MRRPDRGESFDPRGLRKPIKARLEVTNLTEGSDTGKVIVGSPSERSDAAGFPNRAALPGGYFCWAT
jgi:hypothetical protein